MRILRNGVDLVTGKKSDFHSFKTSISYCLQYNMIWNFLINSSILHLRTLISKAEKEKSYQNYCAFNSTSAKSYSLWYVL